jgi:uncharacterized phage-associated protein
MKIYQVNKIATWIIKNDEHAQIIEDMSDTDITNLKLQKLLYYAQGHHLSQFSEPLFNEKIIAWKHGPVVETLYYDLKDCKANPIHEKIFNNPEKYNMPDISTAQSDFLENVIYYYNRLSPWFLRDLTHDENNGVNPWSKTENGQEISHELMQKYFAMPEFSTRIND